MILLLEDNDLDAELMIHQLAESLPATPIRRVHDKRSYIEALGSDDVCLVVCDFSLPDIDGWEALLIAVAEKPEVPFIFVSGVIGEDLAVKALKAGATDYVLKQRLDRLGAAARRAMSEAEDRRARRLAEDALRDSEARFRALADSAPALIWETDAAGAVTFVNRHFEVMFGQSSDAMLGAGWHRIIYPPDLPMMRATFDKAIRDAAAFEQEARAVDANGRLRWLDCRAVPRVDHAGQFQGLTGINVDVTDAKLARDELEHMVLARTAELMQTNERLLDEMRQRADAEAARTRVEEQLRQAQKMEAFGQLTGGVAHDFNNFLTVILGNLETLERQLAEESGKPHDPHRVALALQHAKQGAQRAAALTQRLLAFARRQPLQPRRIDVNTLIAATAEILTRTLGEHVDLRSDLQADVWPIHVDPHMMESALLNLAVNARDAMPGGGEIVIETRNVVFDGRPPCPIDVAPGDYVRVSIRDTGTGIAPEILEKVFEPFFTTKDVGVGTGLGLSQVYGFVKQSGGHVAIDSTVGVGTAVHLHLPRYTGVEAQAGEGSADAALPAAKGEAILVVEDDEAVRAHSAAVLAELGYTVHQACDAASALQCLRAHPEIALLFTDVGLPKGFNGPDLAEAARRARPGLRVLYTSGYAEGRLTHGGQLPPGVALIPKPFTYTELARRVRTILDDGGFARDGAAPMESAADSGPTFGQDALYRHPADSAAAQTAPVAPAVLPAQTAQPAQPAQPAQAAQSASTTRTSTVLLVEDDELVRMLTTDALTGYGFEVVEADTAKAALASMKSGGIGAAIVDLGLPDMPGSELVRRLAQEHPGLPIIVASGYGAIDVGNDMPAGARLSFVQKPYELERLRTMLHDAGLTAAPGALS
ncbi:response regulator [Bordetella genomosp. 9]|uniref:histidine kinase n=1 Tax=Bordetella genomosp. 9 TaxID=1416803 RepID=A0A1W6Z059_9BORD|nr:response regulator [Bordetella genomosp. 9]ARP86752.1 hypothetical protein CAL13_11445 [Bordetella genomosp. 9]